MARTLSDALRYHAEDILAEYRMNRMNPTGSEVLRKQIARRIVAAFQEEIKLWQQRQRESSTKKK